MGIGTDVAGGADVGIGTSVAGDTAVGIGAGASVDRGMTVGAISAFAANEGLGVAAVDVGVPDGVGFASAAAGNVGGKSVLVQLTKRAKPRSTKLAANILSKSSSRKGPTGQR